MKLQTSFSVPRENMGDIGRKHEAVKRGMTAIASYWERECALNPSSPACLIFEDQLLVVQKEINFPSANS